MPPESPKTLALTIGDPTGIGPEICVRFLNRWATGDVEAINVSMGQEAPSTQARLRIYGDLTALERMAKQLHLSLPLASESLRYQSIIAPTTVSEAAIAGRIAYGSLEAAVADIHQGQAIALITGPISKENLYQAGLAFEGHTEILQALVRRDFDTEENCQSDMLFLYQKFRMLLLTRHIPLRQVSEALTIEGVSRSLESLCGFLTKTANLPKARIGLLGVNPHAGESMGKNQTAEDSEETRILKPAIAAVSNRFPDVIISPPLAADGAFRGFSASKPAYDAYVATYHDQGLIPFKMAAGLQAVNVTIGLPFLRTSVSHGTAPDIVGKGIASEESLIAAYQTALSLLATGS
jgi:4-hydroxythreonine-4-phosphate dehydrogenase